jgi:hypothetical protein
VFKKISKVHNNGRVLQFIEPSECRMGGEALQLLRILRLKDTIMEAVMSKVFVECKKFHFIGQIVSSMMDFGNSSLPFVNCGTLSFGY